MTINKIGSTSILTDNVWIRVKSLLGSQFTYTGKESKTITYVNGRPDNYEAYLDKLPLVFMEEAQTGNISQFSIGGPRTYPKGYRVHVIAGGYKSELENQLMKMNMIDTLKFGFDNKQLNYTNSITGVVEGRYRTSAIDINRIASEINDKFEKNHGEVLISTLIEIVNN